MFKLSIITPNGSVTKNLAVNSLLVPTEVGTVNILPGHTHLLAKMKEGVVEATTSNGQKHYFSSTFGLLKVLGSDVVLLLKTSEKSEDIDYSRAQKAKEKALENLNKHKMLADVNYVKFKRKLDRANVRLKLAELNK